MQMMKVLWPFGVGRQLDKREAFATLSRFRAEFYECLSGRGDALFDLADALLADR
ncbi:hypothetical protein [Streptomyces sp. TRM68367]|uniref:hypothetical protein n=1 Tax=Streptomyces sp. TRM68367 TaxID=2758415 RepID=UPI00165AC8D7|nr:hypothetical protein [Streptomyces sp. TRM68367]MBC9730191.1 hypothetical protein [Streptomyces sp. TRM68367]